MVKNLTKVQLQKLLNKTYHDFQKFSSHNVSARNSNVFLKLNLMQKKQPQTIVLYKKRNMEPIRDLKYSQRKTYPNLVAFQFEKKIKITLPKKTQQ